jgi:tetratricopeptide (TPR) repeat protein
MRSFFLPSLLGFVIVLPCGAFGQARTGRAQPPDSIPSSSDPFSGRTMQPVFISGRVILADGSKVSERVAIQTACGDRKRIETYTDSQGKFSFEVKAKPESLETQTADMSTFGGGTFSGKGSGAAWQNCELRAVLPGFTAQPIMFASAMSTFQSTNIGSITLKPIANAEGSVLSVTSLAAPDAARKAFEKASDLEKKNKVDEAQQSLEKAVNLYPQYAVAWSELGRLQYLKHDRAAAQHSFEQALAADSKYAKPYLWLAQMAVDSQQWTTVVDVTGKLLALNSTTFPGAWFLNATGHYNLQNFDAAEHSAREGMKADSDHRIPRMEYLLGLALAKRNDFTQAAEHIRQFLRSSNNPAEIAEAQAQLAQIEQLMTTSTPAQK